MLLNDFKKLQECHPQPLLGQYNLKFETSLRQGIKKQSHRLHFIYITTSRLDLFALSWFAESIGKVAFSAILSVEVVCHKDACTTRLLWAFPAKAGDFSILIYLVVFQSSQLDLMHEQNI